MDIEQEYEKEFAWGLPISFEGIYIYPVHLKDLFLFKQVATCLQIEPRSLTNQRYKSMSRLKFILETYKLLDASNIDAADVPYKSIPQLFTILMYLVLGENQQMDLMHPSSHKLNGKVLHIYRPMSQSEDGRIDRGAELILTPKKFDVFRKIILLQNGIDITDEDLDPIMRKVYAEDMQRLNRNAQDKQITEESKIDLVSISMNSTRQSIQKYVFKGIST